MLKIPTKEDSLKLWVREVIDECMGSAQERSLVLQRAAQYYYQGSYDSKAAIYNKVRSFVDRLAGFLMQPTDVRFSMIFDSGEPEDVLERAQLVSEKLTADYRQSDNDVTFAEAVVWSLVNGCVLLKHLENKDTHTCRIAPIHPQHFGVLSETILSLDEQEAFCHISFPSLSRLRNMLEEMHHPRVNELMERVLEGLESRRDDSEGPSFFHQMMIGGLQPLGNIGDRPEAAGVVNVFPVPTPWKPQRKVSEVVQFCELWIKDADQEGDYTTIQVVYPDIIIEGDDTRRNVSKIAGRSPFVKIQAVPTPGYFWGRSVIADIQMLQDVLNKRLRDLKVMWDRNAAAPYTFSGFTSITEETYYKLISEGGFVNDPNPNAKAQKLTEPPPPGYIEELEFIWKMFDEASGFSPIMSGQGEPGVRAGVHAQTLVRTSSPRLIDQAARIERQLAESGYLNFRIMQALDLSAYRTDSGIEFLLTDIPDNFQIQVDSHSASPAFAEDNRQIAIALHRAGAIDDEDLVHMLHPPSAELILAKQKQRHKAQAQAAQQQHQEELMKDVLGIPQHKQQRGGGRARR
jgi:hypothetical protein